MAEQFEPRKDELPAFTGNVPEDTVRTGRLLRHRALFGMRRTGVGFGVSCAVAFAAFILVGAATPWPDWAQGERLSVPTVVVLGTVAVLAGAACFVRAIPGWVRFLLAALPSACVSCIGGVGNAAWGVYPWATPVGMLGLIGTIVYIVVSGWQVKGWATARLARFEASQ